MVQLAVRKANLAALDESPLVAWLSRIVMNEALGRLRRKPATSDFAPFETVPEAEIIQGFRDNAELRRQFLGMIE